MNKTERQEDEAWVIVGSDTESRILAMNIYQVWEVRGGLGETRKDWVSAKLSFVICF